MLLSKLNTRNNYINEFLKAKKFKNFDDAEDSVNHFQKSQEIADFSQLNILSEMKLEDILESLNNIKFKGIQDFLTNLEQAKKLIISVRKMVCRNLNKNNSPLLVYGCDVILIDILVYFTQKSFCDLKEIEFIIIVRLLFLKFKLINEIIQNKTTLKISNEKYCSNTILQYSNICSNFELINNPFIIHFQVIKEKF